MFLKNSNTKRPYYFFFFLLLSVSTFLLRRDILRVFFLRSFTVCVGMIYPNVVLTPNSEPVIKLLRPALLPAVDLNLAPTLWDTSNS